MIQGMTGQLPRGIDPLAARRLYGGSGDIGAEGRVAPATKGGLPGIVDVDLRTGKGVSSTFRRPDMETSNVPTYDRGAGQYIYDGAMRSTPLTSGLDKNGKVDRRQSDEYKATRARYDQLRKDDPEKALDYGLQEWAKMYPELAARQQQGSFGSRAQGEGGYDYEALMAERARRDMQSPDPLMQQEMQQQATAAQADKATTAGMSGSALDRTDQFLTEFGPFFTPKQSNVRFPDPSGRTPGINPNPFSISILN